MFIVLSGKRGSGKSALAVRLALAAAMEGKNVWSNIPLDFSMYGEKIKGKIFFAATLEDIGDMRDGLFLLDEAHLVASAGHGKNLSEEAHAYISLSRHLGMDLVFISQNFRRLAPIVREIAEQIWRLRRLGKLSWYKKWDEADIGSEGKPLQKSKSVGIGWFWHSEQLHKCYDDKDLVIELLRKRKPRQWVENGRSSLPPQGSALVEVSGGLGSQTAKKAGA